MAADSTPITPTDNYAVVIGKWTNTDGTSSAPVSCLNSLGDTTDYACGESLVKSDGSLPGGQFFTLLNGSSTFAVSSVLADFAGQLATSGASASATVNTVSYGAGLQAYRLATVPGVRLGVQRISFAKGWVVFGPAVGTAMDANAMAGAVYQQAFGSGNGTVNVCHFSGSWKCVTGSDGDLVGTDFSLASGQGYAISSSSVPTSNRVTLLGTPSNAFTVTPVKGWSVFSLTTSGAPLPDADALIVKLFQSAHPGGGSGTLNVCYLSGSWKCVTDSGGDLVGTDFQLVPGQGYALSSDANGTAVTVSS